MSPTTRLRDAIVTELGAGAWLDRAELDAHLVDFRGVFRGEAAGMIRPASTDEVSAAVRICADEHAAVVTQGGNTGLSGGAIPAPTTAADARPRVLLSTQRLRAIEEINPERSTITAQAGVTIERLQDAARDVDRLFAPDWGARGTATIGGAIATNAGGINVLRHGNLREQVLGIEAVLADGRVWDGLRALPKDNSGVDLKHLFIGSEGCLGIVTRAVVRVVPRPAEHRLAFASLGGLERLDALFTAAQSHTPGALSAFELIPEVGVAQVVDRFDVIRPIGTRAEWYVLIRFSGSPGVADALLDLLADASTNQLITDGVIAESTAQEANLWLLRDELTATRSFGGFGVKYDLAIPPDRVATFLADAAERVESVLPGALPYAFGHVGDGNLHFTVLTPDTDDSALMAARSKLVGAIDDLVWSFDGTISAEHGIGRELRERIVGQKDPIEFELMRHIKSALDPDDVFNPGVMLPD